MGGPVSGVRPANHDQRAQEARRDIAQANQPPFKSRRQPGLGGAGPSSAPQPVPKSSSPSGPTFQNTSQAMQWATNKYVQEIISRTKNVDDPKVKLRILNDVYTSISFKPLRKALFDQARIKELLVGIAYNVNNLNLKSLAPSKAALRLYSITEGIEPEIVWALLGPVFDGHEDAYIGLQKDQTGT
jgi:hypothetical protein